MDLSSDVSINLDDTGLTKNDGTAFLGSEAIPVCLSESSGHSDERSTRSPASFVYSDGYLDHMDPLAKNICRDENLSSLSPVLVFGLETKGSLDLSAVSVSAAIDFPMLGLSDPLCTSGSVCFASSETSNLVNEQGNLPSETGRTDGQTAKTVCIRLFLRILRGITHIFRLRIQIMRRGPPLWFSRTNLSKNHLLRGPSSAEAPQTPLAVLFLRGVRPPNPLFLANLWTHAIIP